MEGTTARLRKTFRYPAENDSDDSLPEALDEEGLSLPNFLLPSIIAAFSFPIPPLSLLYSTSF